jgi:predicted amidohydrolase YtcJ
MPMTIPTRGTLAVALLVAATAIVQAETKPTADLIVTGGRLWTVDAKHPQAEAIAVVGERIVAVGTAEQIDAWRGQATKVIDAHSRRVVPGFNDAHVHFVSGGQQLESVDLRDAATPDEFARRIAKHAANLAEKEWVTGGTWDDQRWTPRQLPTKQLVDPLTPKTPVFVTRLDGHMGLANSLALRLAGIGADTPEPAGGVIVRGADGEPTGILKDAAMDLVTRVIPPLSHEQRLRFAKRALEHAAGLGVTSAQHMNCTGAEFSVYAQLAESGELTARIYAAPMETRWQDQAKLGLRRAFGSTYLRLGAVKGFADGSLGASTAYFFEPYSDDPKNRGLLSDEMQPLAGMLDRMTRADAAGLQLCIHGIGDRAISEVLDLFAQVSKANGSRDRRFRIEHAQHVAPQDFARFCDLGVIASVQPYHAIDDGRWAEARIGPLRAESTYAFRTFIDGNVRLALGTDWPVAPLNPLFTIYAAVTRATLDGRRNEGWVPKQKITVAEAVTAYTLGSAYAEFQETAKGSLEVGKLADMVILDQDIFSIPPRDIRDVKVERTIVGGRVVFDRSKAP